MYVMSQEGSLMAFSCSCPMGAVPLGSWTINVVKGGIAKVIQATSADRPLLL